MLDKKSYPIQFYVVSGLGASVILSLGVAVTAAMWHYGFRDATIATNYTTSFLFPETVRMATVASPWALASLNGFLCKYGIKAWRKWAKHYFGSANQPSLLQDVLHGKPFLYVIQRLGMIWSSVLQK